MAGLLSIKQGGKIRSNFPTVVGQTWSRGQAIIINSRGELEKFNGQTNAMVGLALENCVGTTASNVIQDTTTVVSGRVGSILLGESVVENDNLSGAGNWNAGTSVVYAQIGGNLSYSSASGISVGKALSDAGSNGRLLFLFRPALGT